MGSAAEAGSQILLPSGQPLIRLGRGEGSRLGFRIAVTASEKPICVGLGEKGGRPATGSGAVQAASREPRTPVSPVTPRAQGVVPPGLTSFLERVVDRPGTAPTPPPRPLTLGRAPPHLTLPRRGSPAEPAEPRPTEQRRAGEGQAPLTHAH